jgi:hypothetical protein
VSFPEFPKSQIQYDTDVKAVGEREWSTEIRLSGTYDAPTDVIAVKDYEIAWTTDGKTLFEKGSATLQLSSGRSLRSTWSSSIVPGKPGFAGFRPGGETVNVTFSPFKIDGNKMSYEWQGTVRPTPHK